MLARLLALVLGLLLAAAFGWLVVDQLGAGDAPPIRMLEERDTIGELVELIGDSEVAGIGSSRGLGGHLLLNEPVANSVFRIREQGMHYDPFAYFRRPAFQDLSFRWSEHPDGGWTLRTNSLGLREDGELAAERPDLRIFVTGDSHTDGVCDNDESYPNQLEALLAASAPGRSVEVLNAGVGGYSFYNYLGAYDRYAEFGMDAYVIGVYGGNDFREVLAPWRFFHGEPSQPRLRDPEKGAAARAVNLPALSQAFFAYAHFAERSADEALAVEAAIEATLALSARCEGAATRLIVAYIPPLHDVAPEAAAEDFAALRAIFELDDEELRVCDRQADAYLAALEAEGVEVLDLRPVFRAAAEPIYWLRDHHINLAGHRLVAEQLARLFE